MARASIDPGNSPSTPGAAGSRAAPSDPAQGAPDSPLRPSGAPAQATAAIQRLLRAPALGAIAATILVYAFFAIASSGDFVTGVSTASWLNTASELGIIAIPVAVLMIAGEFDLSIGSMVAAGSITVGVIVTHLGDPVWLAFIVAMAIAVVVGVVNGLLVTWTGLPSFIVTLGANFILSGLALALSVGLTGTTTVSVSATGFWQGFFAHQFGQFDISIFWWVALALLAIWVMMRSRFGPWILATGGNDDQARRAGVLTSRVKILLFVATAMGAAFVGMIQAITFNTADATTGQGYVFEAPIVCVIGGVLLTGGFGSVVGVAVATVLFGVIGGGLFYTGWNTNLSQVILGSLMIIAVLTNNQLRKFALSAATGRKRRQA